MPSSMTAAATKFQIQLSSPTSPLQIGCRDSPKTYHIPEDLLRPLIKGLVNNLDAQSAPGEFPVKLAEDDIDIANLFIFWLYREALPAWDWTEDNEVTSLLADDLCKAWIMGANLKNPAFQDCVMENLCDVIGQNEKCVSARLMHYVYPNTAPGSVLRTLLADVLAVRLNGDGESIHDWKELHTVEGFAADLHHADQWYWENNDKASRYMEAEEDGDRKVYMVSDLS